MLRFTPYAWAKLQWFCHRGETEIGGFGLSGDPDDLLLVTDFITVPQRTSAASVCFEDTAVGDFFEDQVDAGLKPTQFARLWCHTHPGNSTVPSSTDEETFQRVFGGCDWAVMFILARSGKTYARLRFNVGPGGQAVIPVEVDYGLPFLGSDFLGWQAEFDVHIHPDLHAGSIAGWEADDFAAWSQRRQLGLDQPGGDVLSGLPSDVEEWIQDEIDAFDQSLWNPR